MCLLNGGGGGEEAGVGGRDDSPIFLKYVVYSEIVNRDALLLPLSFTLLLPPYLLSSSPSSPP